MSTWSQIGNALLAWLTPQLSTLNPAPARVGWDKSLERSPRYPTEPRTDCPRILLRAAEDRVELLTGRGQRDNFAMSLFVQLRQVPGDNHQTKLLDYVEQLTALFVGAPNAAGLCAAGIQLLTIERVIIHDEQHHEFDEPALRVSLAEVQLEIEARRYQT